MLRFIALFTAQVEEAPLFLLHCRRIRTAKHAHWWNVHRIVIAAAAAAAN